MLVQDQSAHRPVSTLILELSTETVTVAHRFRAGWNQMGKRHAPNHAKSHLPVRANGLLARIDRGGVVGAIRFTDFTQAVLSDHVDAVVRHIPPRKRQSCASSLQGNNRSHRICPQITGFARGALRLDVGCARAAVRARRSTAQLALQIDRFLDEARSDLTIGRCIGELHQRCRLPR
jgi:hypothetical protein